MGLDIYVGSLTRYFSRDWKTILQQWAESGKGPPFELVRENEPSDVVTDPEQIRPAVVAWREGLNQALAAHVASPIAWDEHGETPYFTDKPGWSGHGALVLWTAYSEHPDLPRPPSNPLALPDRTDGDWHEDVAYRRSTTRGFATRYGQLLDDVEVWLPAEFSFTFEAQWVTGTTIRFGSCQRLVAQLDALNASTWNVTAVELERWRHDGAEFDAPLEVSARFAFAVARTLAGQAVAHKLPMLLDY